MECLYHGINNINWYIVELSEVRRIGKQLVDVDDKYFINMDRVEKMEMGWFFGKLKYQELCGQFYFQVRQNSMFDTLIDKEMKSYNPPSVCSDPYFFS